MFNSTIPLTRSALNEKKAELVKLTKLRVEVVKRLATAREMGDLSENGAYSSAKFELGNVGRQLRAVKHILKHSYIPIPTALPGVVAFGRTVSLKSQGKNLTFLLVSQYESDPSANKLSLESPIGRAIVGKKVGDVVTVKTPRGEIEYRIEAVK